MNLLIISISLRLILAYTLYTYFSSPLVWLLLKSINYDLEYHPYGTAYEPQPFTIFIVIFLSIGICLTSRKKNLQRGNKFLESYLNHTFDLRLSLSYFAVSLYLFFTIDRSFRYSEESILSFGIAGIVNYTLPSIIVLTLLARFPLKINKHKRLRWMITNFFYLFAIVLSGSGLSTLFDYLLWGIYVLNARSCDNLSYLKLFGRSLALFCKKLSLNMFSLCLLLVFLSLPIISQLPKRVFAYAESYKSLDFTSKLSTESYDKLILDYIVGRPSNIPAYYTAQKAFEVSSMDKVRNTTDILNNFFYRLSKIIGFRYQNPGLHPNVTNIQHIAIYKYGDKEGTSPGLWFSFNYYINPLLGFPLEFVYALFFAYIFSNYLLSSGSPSVLSLAIYSYFGLHIFLASPLSLFLIDVTSLTFICFILLFKLKPLLISRRSAPTSP